MKIRCWCCKKVTELDKPPDDNICPHCGTILEAENEVKPKANKGVRNNP